MTVPRRPPARSSDQVMQTLKWIRKQGFQPVPLHPRSKAAVSRDYVDHDYKPPDDELWSSGDYGVGVVLGPRHGGPVDGDIDSEEAVFFASRFMPNTNAVFGRPGKRRSHYVYRVDAAFEKIAFVDPISRDTIVELRGDGGHQTVFPGSLHEATGELITWEQHAFPDVTTVAASDLTDAARNIAIATLIARHVWTAGYHNEPCKHLSGVFFYLEWSLERAEAVIQAVMDYTDDHDKSRIPTVRATYRRGEAGNKISGAGVLRKQLKNDLLVDKLLEWAGSPTVNLLQEYNEKFAMVEIEGNMRIGRLTTGGRPPVFYTRDNFLIKMARDYAPVTDDKGKRISKAKLWLADPRCRQYEDVDFLPGVEDEETVFNLWSGWGVMPDPAGSCKAWLRLLKEVICGNDARLNDWMLHWFANIVREPLDKSLTAPVIIGPEGAGKSLMLAYFGEILGSCYVTVTKEEHIYGRFNKHIASALLLHSEEALYGGEKRHAGIVRSLITDRYQMFEAKGIDARQVRNYLRLVLTSNELHAAPAKPGDRRYTVIAMGDRKAPDALIKDVLREFKDGGPAALHQFLREMKYDPALPRLNVKNDALVGLKQMNMTPLEEWWHETLMAGQVLPDYMSWCTQPEKEGWPAVVSSKALSAAASIHIQAHGRRMTPSPTLLALQLNRFTGATLDRQYRLFDDPLLDGIPPQARNLGERHYAVINMPDLDACRDAFEKYLGQQIEWPEEDDCEQRRKPGDDF